MTFNQFVFYLFSAIMVISALRMITVRNPVHAVLHLVLTFFTAAVLWVQLGAEFLGIVLVLVYVGAVMVLFVFVVMMLDINIARMREGFVRFLPVGLVVALIMLGEMLVVLTGRVFRLAPPPMPPAGYSNTEALAGVLYTGYVYPFEIAAFVLLVAIIAAIALTLRRRPGTLHQDPAAQIRVRARDRLRIVKMDAEKRS
ncbi:MAG TPA: NADH-quinone oxidoreductase subunit J [Chromatiales bacterium]|nr:NADH-quinone oxidoreductase subunit J [Chromatiales bacterium]